MLIPPSSSTVQAKHIFDELRLELVSTIAEGGMGVVYEALQHGTGDFRKVVALKLIREEYSSIDEFKANFMGEAKLVANLIHTNIVQTYHLGEMGGQYYMTMEFINGINLEQFLQMHIDQENYMPVNLAVFIVSRICRGLAYAHQKCGRDGRLLGIVHRDVGPRNIMIAREGDVKLTDFGIAKALDIMYNEEGHIVVGKDAYLSPEQARREITDARADLFACGIVLTEILFLYNMFESEDGDPSSTRENIRSMEVSDFREYREDIDEGLNKILLRALAKDRDERFQTAAEMLEKLERYIYSDGYGPTNEKLAAYLADMTALAE